MKLLEELFPVRSFSLARPLWKSQATQRDSKQDPASVAWRGEFFSARSFAHVNRESVRALIAQGASVRVIPTDTKPEPEVYEWPSVKAIQPYIATDQSTDLLLEFLAEGVPPPTKNKTIYLIVWESFLLPQRFVEAIMQREAQVWAPSSPVIEACLRSQIPAERIALIPHGVDLDVFTSSEHAPPPLPLDPGPSVRFLFSGVTHYRKGVDVAVRAFQEEFTRGEPVALIIKDAPSSYGWGANLRNELQSLSDERIVYLVERYSSQQMAALYRSVDIVLAPSRGEGFNIPIIEAMACGKPVITTMTGVAPDLTGGFLPIEATPVIDPKWSEERSPLTASMWLAPSVASLRTQMRRLFEDEALRTKLSRDSLIESQRYSWSNIGALMLRALRTT